MAISPSPFDRISKPRRGGRPRLWLAWAALAALLVLAVVLFRQPAANVFWRVVAPVVRMRETFGDSQAAELRAELASTSAALADRDALYKENIDLKERLGRDDALPQRVLAAVLERPPLSPYDTLLIDAGSAEGVAAGDRVAAAGTALIGQVSEVYAAQSRVTLYSAPGQSYQAVLNGAVPVSVEGQGGGSMRAEVPAGTQVAAGDTVQFPGLMGGIAAKVSAVDAKMGESFIDIYMQLPADPSQLQFVEVWK